MMAMSVMPATAAITIQRVLFFSPPAPAWAAAALVSVGAGELNPAEEENKELPYVIASPQDVLWGSFVTHSFLDERTPKDVCGEATYVRDSRVMDSGL